MKKSNKIIKVISLIVFICIVSYGAVILFQKNEMKLSDKSTFSLLANESGIAINDLTEPDYNIDTKLIDKSAYPANLSYKFFIFGSTKTISPFNFDYSRYLTDSLTDGVFCYRGNNYRDSGVFGALKTKPTKLTISWVNTINALGKWSGVGWNGQPVIIKWSDETKNMMNIFPAKKAKKDLTEVIYATLDGNIYFCDIDDGSKTRNPINIGYPTKGSVAIDPRGYPLLYTGQGIPDVPNKPKKIGYRIFSLIDQKEIYFINGIDNFAYRRWGAFDSGPIIDAKSDQMVICGENGIIYIIKLNTKYDKENRKITVKPDIIKYKYTTSKSKKYGMESHVAGFGKYIFISDNDGVLQCVNLNALKPVWARFVNDDTDSTVVIENKGDEFYLYTACEVDAQGINGQSYIRKFNAKTGKELWVNKIKCRYDANVNGGALATPALGKNNLNDLVFFNIAKINNTNQGQLIAYDKNNGRAVWTLKLDNYCWSSPVVVYSEDGKGYILQCDSIGRLMIIDGLTEKKITSINLGSNVEGTPAVYGNKLVVGTRGQKIICVTIL